MENKTIWSEYQNRIFAFAELLVSFVVNAVAGSGKTTTMVELAFRLAKTRRKVLFLAFNRSIANELKGRVQGTTINASTLHSYGYACIRSAFGYKTKYDMNPKKWLNYLDTHELYDKSQFEIDANGTIDTQKLNKFLMSVIKLFDKCRINLVESNDHEGIKSVAEKHFDVDYEGYDIVFDDRMRVVSELLKVCYQADFTDNKVSIDYTDMIVLPITDPRITKAVKRYHTYQDVIIDEAQDLNKAQQSLMRLAIAKGGRFIAVGDPRQAINGFAGADAESFHNLKVMANDNELPLSCCYRCGKNIVNSAKTIVPNITYYEGSCDGTIDYVADFKKLNKGDMVLCRTSAPLVGLCLKMLASGISAYVKGQDLCEGLKNMVAKSKTESIPELFEVLDKEIEKRIRVAEKKGIENPSNSPQVVAYKDKVECLKVISGGCLSCSDLVKTLDKVFDEVRNGDGVCLSTIHKAKGLESNNVFIILPNKLPLVFPNQKEWEYEQELNLKYVAITRAKKELHWVTLSEEQLATYQF